MTSYIDAKLEKLNPFPQANDQLYFQQMQFASTQTGVICGIPIFYKVYSVKQQMSKDSQNQETR